MSIDPAEAANEASKAGASAGAGETQTQPGAEDRSEADQRAAYEAEMSRISSADMILQATVSLLNIGGYRLGLSTGQDQPGGAARDLEQVRDAIDGARALLPILERRGPEEMRPLRDALSQLQMAYAREAGTSAPAGQGAAQGAQGAQTPPPVEQDPPAKQDSPSRGETPDGPGPAQSSGRLWVPGR